jgi:antirestriction protein ArdC
MRGGQYWTWKQVKDAGLKVRKGCHAEQIFFWKKFVKSREVEFEGEVFTEIGGVGMMMRSYNVFHESDVEGAPQSRDEYDPSKNAGSLQKPDEVIESYFRREERIRFCERECVPHYSYNDLLGIESIEVPPKCLFDTLEDYYHTMFHEMVHSTGAPWRLDRSMGGGFGSSVYAKEELVAEMGASQLAAECRLPMDMLDNSSSYCANWLGKLKNDINNFIWAASRADKAVDYILDRHPVEESQQTA